MAFMALHHTHMAPHYAPQYKTDIHISLIPGSPALDTAFQVCVTSAEWRGGIPPSSCWWCSAWCTPGGWCPSLPQGHFSGLWAICSLPGPTRPAVQSHFPASWPLAGGSHCATLLFWPAKQMLLIPPSVQLRLKVMRLQVSKRTQPPCPSSPWGCTGFWPPPAVRVPCGQSLFPSSSSSSSSRHPGVPQRVPRSPLTVSGEVPRRQTGPQSTARTPWCLPAVLCCGALWDWREAAALVQCFLEKKLKKKKSSESRKAKHKQRKTNYSSADNNIHF